MDQKKICAKVPKINNAYCLKELREKKIFLSDVSFKSGKCLYEENVIDIHLLLGADIAGKILTGKIEHLSCGLVAMHYIMGWTVMGKVSNEINLDSSYLTLSLFVNEAKITDLWNLDSLDINDPCEKQSKEEVLTRFRMRKIGATADTCKAFLPISQDEHDRDYMRFIWWKDGDPEKEIRNLSDPERLNYVSGALNPRDLPSRRCNVEALSISRWWKGPAWLRKPMNKWPKSEKLPNFEIINLERKNTLISVTNTDNKKIFDRFSSYEKLIRVFALIYRFLDNCRIERSERALEMLTSEGFDRAEELILKIVQREAFTGIEDKRLKSLQPWKDEKGLLREKSQVQVGDIVFVSSDNHKKIDWNLARVIQLFPSKDGDVRLTKVKMKNGELLRPIDRLIPLELSVEMDALKNLRSRHGLLRKERV
ncbi:integrase catalytic domain-containing protein [Trichonephila clavata]|uniref:Integrase catalytic domain-containing protein n=1 Tax=Trichonephila clavata TaxID=2740835 RepID=A0A8X6GGB2_TRICU|nr:integrase catalytic domain-containing protein [Trichonephila clavata]